MKKALLIAAVIVAASCSNDEAVNPVGDAGAGGAGTSLVALGLFKDAVAQTPADGIIPYDVISILYSDNASKLRFISVPKGTKATFSNTDPWDYPDGSFFIKTFYYPKDKRDESKGRKLIETRVVAKEAGDWTAKTYVWNDAQTDATLLTTGTSVDVSYIDENGAPQSLAYRVPNQNQCASCHARHHILGPLGPRTEQLNRDHDYGSGPENQIDHLVKLGWLQGDIPPIADRSTLSDPFGSDSVDKRARSYFEANCSHCHRSGGNAGASGLDLEITTTDAAGLGICRIPSAAGPASGGHTYDVIPGDPADSIMIFRMSSVDPEFKMPQIPTVTSDAKGVALIQDWINQLPQASCSTTDGGM